MDAVKYFKVFRKALLSTLAFWCFFALTRTAYALCVTIYADQDTAFVGLHPSINIVFPILSLLLLIPYSFDCYVGDSAETQEYIDNVDYQEFSFKADLISCCKTIEFITARVVWLLFSLIVFNVWFTLLVLLINTCGEIFAHRRWFYCMRNGEEVKPKKRPYFFTLLGSCARWVLMVFAVTMIIAILKNTLGSIWAIVSRALLIALAAVIAYIVFSLIYSRIRAIRIQSRLIKMLTKTARDNGYRFKTPSGVYSSLLRQRPLNFTLEKKDNSKNCVIIPNINRSVQLYFLGSGVVQRVKRYCFFKIELFYTSKYTEYKFRDTLTEQERIIILSPIPREFFIGPVGKPAVGDNGSEIDNALIFSGTAFCNHIERTSNQRIYEKEIH